MNPHHVEVFRNDDMADTRGEWGWECFEPTCREEATGFEDFDAAESSADEHVRTAGQPTT